MGYILGIIHRGKGQFESRLWMTVLLKLRVRLIVVDDLFQE